MRRIEVQNRIDSLPRAWRLPLRGNSGNTLVETALSIAILMTLVVGIMEASLAVYSYHFISNAAREGVRYAIVRGDTWTQDPWDLGSCGAYTDSGCVASVQNIQDYVKSLSFLGINPDYMTVTPTSYTTFGTTACPQPTVTTPSGAKVTDPSKALACNSQTDVIEVTVEYDFPFTVPGIPSRTLSMSSTASMVVSQ